MKSSRSRLGLKAALIAGVPGAALAHPSEQGLVLLLPTDIYIASGVAAVAATVALLAVAPPGAVRKLSASASVPVRLPRWAPLVTSCLSLLLLCALIFAGFSGPRDPLANPLPLMVWTVFWIGFVTLQALLGDLWSWVNPWRGPVHIARRFLGLGRPRPLRTGTWPGVVTFLAFAGFLLADPAPSDPDRLALVAALYWLAHFALGLVFGPRWLRRGEGVTLALTVLARNGIAGRLGGRLRLGLCGWHIAARRLPMGMAVMAVLLLGTGSFDGVNETFWWLTRLGLNPFEFPGRSAIVPQVLAGLLIANALLLVVFAVCIWLGLRLARSNLSLANGFSIFAPTLLPIAVGYHIAHYLTSFMVDGQYALVALSDPLMTGADLLNLGAFYVTTGFFNTTESVRVIFLTQAGAVVLGHILSVLLAHTIALRAFGSHRRAAVLQLPIAVFMVFYTFFGLWLLASPRF